MDDALPHELATSGGPLKHEVVLRWMHRKWRRRGDWTSRGTPVG
jgi:hypothetical protein